MGRTYDLNTYRARHLPKRLSRQMARVRQDLIDHQNHLSAVEERLKEYANILKSMNLELQRHQEVCEKSQTLNEKCEQALTEDDLDQLIKLRDKLAAALEQPAPK